MNRTWIARRSCPTEFRRFAAATVASVAAASVLMGCGNEGRDDASAPPAARGAADAAGAAGSADHGAPGDTVGGSAASVDAGGPDAPLAPGAPGGTNAPNVAGTPVLPPWFRDEAAERGIDFVHDSGARLGTWAIPEITAGGLALLDVDDDGDLDLLCVQGGGDFSGDEPSGGQAAGHRLYRNQGDGTFVDDTVASGVGPTPYGVGAATADVDGDGDTDILITTLGRDALLINQGGGRFRDEGRDRGLTERGFSAGASFFDFDADGDLDLFVARYMDWSPERERECFNELGQRDYCDPAVYQAAVPDRLYRNDGSGRFTDVTDVSGVGAAPGTGLGVVVDDFDGDGRPDVFVANDGMHDHLWINRGDGTFSEEGMLRGCAADDSGRAKAGMGVWATDRDNDGDPDLLVGNLVRETDSLFRNDGGLFVDITARAGLAARSRAFTRWGLGFVDFDHDGRQDLYLGTGRVRWQSDRFSESDIFAEPDLLFRGGEAGRLVPVAELESGSPSERATSARAVAFGDVDGDGAVDAVVLVRDGQPRVLINQIAPADRPALVLDVRAATGGPAIGAIVRVTVEGPRGEREIRRRVATDGSFCAARDPRVSIGLAEADVVRRIEVQWPGSPETRRTFRPAAGERSLRLGPIG
ncbi:MAG: CRTAC1 family protein [Phycisphaerales bacterium]